MEALARELDERTYRQELLASFENLGAGRVYYAFEAQSNVAPVAYNSNYGLFWSLDFNVNPMCSVIGQNINGEVRVLDEIVLRDSHTLAACEAFYNWVKINRLAYPVRTVGLWRCEWGEPSYLGLAYGLADCAGFSRAPGERIPQLVLGAGREPAGQGPHQLRECHAAQPLRESRLRIDPRCKQLIRDLEQVCWKTDVNDNPLMELDKSDPMRTHVSDALGYMIGWEFAMQAEFGYHRERLPF